MKNWFSQDSMTYFRETWDGFVKYMTGDQSEIADLKSYITSLVQTREKLSGQIKELEKENQGLKDELELKDGEIKALEELNEELTEEAKNLQQEIDNWHGDIEDVIQTLKEIRSSREQ